MGWFGKKNKNKEKGVPFWKRNKETEVPQEPLVDSEAPETEEEDIAAAAMEELAQQEQDEVEKALLAAEKVVRESDNRKEAIALARQAAIEAANAMQEEPAEKSKAEESEPEMEKSEADDAEMTPEETEAEEPTEETDTAETAAELPEEADGETAEETDSVPEEEQADEDQTQPEPEAETEPEFAEESLDMPEEEMEEEPEAPAEEAPKKRGFFAKIRDGLRKTKDAMMSRMQQVLGGFTKIDDDLFDELEETMIMSDLGPETSVEICDQLRKRVKERGVTDPQAIMGMIQEIITEMLGEDQELEYPTKPTVIMVIGVNGAGKTTTIGKLCHQLKSEGKKVIVAAADTFRAAAIDQLEVWTNRAGVELVKHAEGSDPASVVYDAIDAAKARNCDVLICDTAGRLHNKKNLMQELAKINRILETRAEGCHREILLVLDATTGQNAVNQARLFREVADISGIVLTKLDGTAKGGIIVSIRNELGIPVKLVGVGEKIDDLQPFRGQDFVRALFEPTEE